MSSSDEGSASACVQVDPGVCRFRTRITAHIHGDCVCFDVVSDCPHVKRINEHLSRDLSPFDALRMPFSSNPVYEACGKVLVHSACPIPSAMIKAAEAAAGFGLKRNVKFEFEP